MIHSLCESGDDVRVSLSHTDALVVFLCLLCPRPQKCTELLAHLAPTTSALVLTPDAGAASKQLLLTADRDGKLRVSRYPHAFIIDSFCLGHTK